MKHAVWRKFPVAWVLAAAFFVLFSGGTPEELFSVQLLEEHAPRGEQLNITLSCPDYADKVGTFYGTLTYDPAVVTLESVQSEPNASADRLFHESSDGEVRTLYVMPETAGDPPSSAVLCMYRFSVNDDAPEGAAQFAFSIKQALTLAGDTLPDAAWVLPYTVDAAPDSEAALLELAPSAGELSPSFSPQQYDYALTVPFEVTALEFSAQAEDGATWKVNRKNLGAGGSTTEFRITVTAEDASTKAVYRVQVHRDEKETAVTSAAQSETTPKPTSTPRPTATPKPTNTPKPTATPKPSKTPKPTKTPKPSAAAKPTQTPKPSAGSEGEEGTAYTVVYRDTEKGWWLLLLCPLAVVAAQAAFAPLLQRAEKDRQNHHAEQMDDEDDEIDDA